MHNFNQ